MRPSGRPASSPARQRVDQLLVERRLAATRTEAARLVMAGRVRVDGMLVAKAGQPVPVEADVTLVPAPAYVSRGGDKLAGALDALGVRPTDRICLDVGASTGGFTDCLLQRGARRVYAVDVGRGQLHPRIASDPRVRVCERVNARQLSPAVVPEAVELATVDVSFISLAKVLPAVATCLAADAEVIALVKPQFEVGRGQVGKGGVVRDARRHGEVVGRVAGQAAACGLAPTGVVPSPLRGPKGNREFFLHLRTRGPALAGATLDAAVAAAIEGGP